MPAPKDPEKYLEWKHKLSHAAKEQFSDPEARQKVGRKGRATWNKGISPSDEQRAKMSAARKGKPNPKNSHPLSESARANIGAAGKGRIPWNKGIPMEAQAKEKFLAGRYGRRASDETRAKMSASQRRRLEKRTDEQKAANSAQLHEFTKAITKSTLEEVIAARLDEQGIPYEHQKTIGWYRVDFYLPTTNTIIEGNGCYWHFCEECGFNGDGAEKKRLKDARRHEYLLRKGYTLQIIWEHELKPEMRKFAKRRGT